MAKSSHLPGFLPPQLGNGRTWEHTCSLNSGVLCLPLLSLKKGGVWGACAGRKERRWVGGAGSHGKAPRWAQTGPSVTLMSFQGGLGARRSKRQALMVPAPNGPLQGAGEAARTAAGGDLQGPPRLRRPCQHTQCEPCEGGGLHLPISTAQSTTFRKGTAPIS